MILIAKLGGEEKDPKGKETTNNNLLATIPKL